MSVSSEQGISLQNVDPIVGELEALDQKKLGGKSYRSIAIYCGVGVGAVLGITCFVLGMVKWWELPRHAPWSKVAGFASLAIGGGFVVSPIAGWVVARKLRNKGDKIDENRSEGLKTLRSDLREPKTGPITERAAKRLFSCVESTLRDVKLYTRGHLNKLRKEDPQSWNVYSNLNVRLTSLVRKCNQDQYNCIPDSLKDLFPIVERLPKKSPSLEADNKEEEEELGHL